MTYTPLRFMYPHRDGSPYARTWDVLFNVTYEPNPKILGQARGTTGDKWYRKSGEQQDLGWWTTTIWRNGTAIQDFYGYEADPDYHDYDKFYGRYRAYKSVTSPENITVRLYREHRIGFPWVKLWATIAPTTDANATCHYRGYWWDGDEPLRFIVPKGGSRQLITKAEDAYVDLLLNTEDLDENWIAFWRSDRKYVALLIFQRQPYKVWCSTELRVEYAAQAVTGGVENSFPIIFIGILRLHSGDAPASDELDVAAKIAQSALTWPTGFTEAPLESLLKARVKHTYTYENISNDFGIGSRPVVPIPEVYDLTDPVDFEIQGLYHKIRYVQASEAMMEAAYPVGGVFPTFTLSPAPLKPGALTDSLYEELDAVFAAQTPEGKWADQYQDGRVCTCLMLIYPKLTDTYKAKVKAAVKSCLDYWYGKVAYSSKYGLYTIYWEDDPANEEKAFTDFPPVVHWLFYAAALYTHYVDSGYASSQLTKINQLGDTLEALKDWEGWSYAGGFAGGGPPVSMSETVNEGVMAWLGYVRLLSQAGQLTVDHKARVRLAEAFQFLKNLAYNYLPHWSDPKLINYIRIMDVWDHIWEGWNAWNWAAPIWGLYTPGGVYGGYAYDLHVGNVKLHAEEHGWNNPQSQHFSVEYLNAFNTLLALKGEVGIHPNLVTAFNTRSQLTTPVLKAEYCLHVAAMNEYKTTYIFQIPGR